MTVLWSYLPECTFRVDIILSFSNRYQVRFLFPKAPLCFVFVFYYLVCRFTCFGVFSPVCHIFGPQKVNNLYCYFIVRASCMLESPCVLAQGVVVVISGRLVPVLASVVQ